MRDGRAGEVSITCMILASGEPQNCRVSDYIGGRRFAEAVVKWLNTGIVRFEPARRDGTPVAEGATLAYHFSATVTRFLRLTTTIPLWRPGNSAAMRLL